MTETEINDGVARQSAGFIQYYGTFWKKSFFIDQSSEFRKNKRRERFNVDNIMLGICRGRTGQGNRDKSSMDQAFNFYKQKGIYVLYSNSLEPVYAGQAGRTKKKNNEEDAASSIGSRIDQHVQSKYKNAWEYFSWFGFLTDKDSSTAKDLTIDKRLKIDWRFNEGSANLKNGLSSLEAIIIEAISPRFNARGGDLQGAYFVDQFEGEVKLS